MPTKPKSQDKKPKQDLAITIRISENLKEMLVITAEQQNMPYSKLWRNIAELIVQMPQDELAGLIVLYKNLVEKNKDARKLLADAEAEHAELKERWVKLQAENTALGIGIKQQKDKRRTGKVQPIIVGVKK